MWRGFSLQEALDMAYSEDIDAIYVEPPDANVLTDEDSADEDSGEPEEPDPTPNSTAEPKQLDIPSTSASASVPLYTPRSKRNFSWIRGDLQAQTRDFPEPNYKQYMDLSPVQLFELFLDDEIITFLIEETSRYALFKNSPDPKVSKNEMKCFLAILIVSGYVVLPGKKSYWESQGDVNNAMVSGAMRRDRFVQIMRFLHCADNSKPNLDDKAWKLRPFIEKLKAKYLQHYQPEKHMSYDESMIKYYGRHPCKQFIRGKPIRFGYKMWALNTTSGYLVNCELYQGKNSLRHEVYEKDFGKAAAPFVSMLDKLKGEKERPYELYFDNLFTGLNLLEHLKERGYQGTGTVRENRIPKNCPMSDKKSLAKKERGTYEGTIEKESGIMVVRWVDNNVVSVASTCHGILPVS
ncbi:piggyBac transposable element-derived protein 3-like [Sitophilus oryzae]|uniref:PiggyBac transposable element-derived protein 3-like n=1 Tax=Sitophilus oryzae TaxID=7048 RepID=A0A6J2YTC4_SITOR|nr:piggyBac transposable element-derived protein 3-like [Sitophilus oryzae]